MRSIFNLKATFNRKNKIGLALGSGAARGLSHIGVIKALQEKSIPIDLITGTSIGALVGACFAKHGSIGEFEQLILNINWRKLVGLIDFNFVLMQKGFVRGRRVNEFLRTIIGDIQFKDLKIPLAVIAADVNTGEQVVIKKGSVVEAVRASISLPGAFVAAKKDNRFLIDGGVVNPVPVDIAKEMRATFVIACDVTGASQKMENINKRKDALQRKNSSAEKRKNSVKKIVLIKLNAQIDSFVKENTVLQNKFRQLRERLELFKPNILRDVDKDAPSMFYTVAQAIYSMQYKIVQSQLKDADIVIRPDTGNINTFDFNRSAEAISAGYKATKKALKKLV
jgi:NTE family protein